MVIKIPLKKILLHEETREEHVKELLEEITRDGFLLRPIAVSKLDNFDRAGFYLLHDGHHRTECLKRLGCKFIMANLIDFWSNEIEIFEFQNPDKKFPKEEVVKLALKGEKLGPRTTRHSIFLEGKFVSFQDNDIVEPKISFPLSELK